MTLTAPIQLVDEFAAAAVTRAATLAADVDYTPAPGTAPGQRVAQELLNTLAFYCSLTALAAFAVGAATWAIGGRMMHSSHGAATGKLTMAAAAAGALLLGAGPAIISWAMALGGRA